MYSVWWANSLKVSIAQYALAFPHINLTLYWMTKLCHLAIWYRSNLIIRNNSIWNKNSRQFLNMIGWTGLRSNEDNSGAISVAEQASPRFEKMGRMDCAAMGARCWRFFQRACPLMLRCKCLRYLALLFELIRRAMWHMSSYWNTCMQACLWNTDVPSFWLPVVALSEWMWLFQLWSALLFCI